MKSAGFIFSIVTRSQTKLSMLVLALGGSLFLASGCGQKQETEQTPEQKAEQAKKTAATNASPAVLEAPKLFTDSRKQARFESLFKTYQDAYTAPQPGTLVRAETKSGGRVEGEFIRYSSPETIVIATADEFISLNQSELTEKSQQELFAGVFSRHLAEQLMVMDAADNRDADPNDVFFPPSRTTASEARRFTADRMAPRLGPGRHFAQVKDAELFRGSTVFVVDEIDGWIAVKATEDAPRAIGWIPKFSTFLINPENREAVAREVELLRKDGFIVNIDPRKNEALVDSYSWRISDSASVEGKSRLLAFYCGQQKGVRLYWVDIKDAATGKKLAEYSESKGFRVF